MSAYGDAALEDARFRRPVGQLLIDSAAAHPDRIALNFLAADGATVSLTYAELLARARAGAARLIASLDPGAPVAVLAGNRVGWITTLFACALAGHPVAGLNPALGTAEITQLLADCAAPILITTTDYRGRNLVQVAEQVRGAVSTLHEVLDIDTWIVAGATAADLPTIDPGRPFLIQYTSGTTGRAKGAVLSHRACVTSALTMTDALEPGDHEIWVSPMPLHHVGATVAHAVALAGVAGTYVMLGAFDPRQMVEAVARHEATLLAGVPTIYLGILDDPDLGSRSLPSLRVAMLGGASIAPSLVGRVESHFGARVAVLYGQSESPAITQTSLDDDDVTKAETIGRALALRELRVIDPTTGTLLGPGEIGELCVRSPTSMDGYLNRPDATAEVLDPDGWLHTGDLCSIDAADLVRFHGRLREVILRGGENVYAVEVEDAIGALPGVAQVAVYGVADDRWGEVVAAAVVARDGVTLTVDDLVAGVSGVLAPFKRPVVWQLLDALPMTASGKVQKFRLAQAATN